MNNKALEKNMGVISWTPLVLFTAWFAYYMVLIKDFIAGKRLEDHLDIAGTTAANYGTLFFTLAIVCSIAAAVLLYMVWHVWTRTNLPAGQKVVWVIFLVMFGAFAFPVYWYMHFKNNIPRNTASPALG
jgi:hypothetical protein